MFFTPTIFVAQLLVVGQVLMTLNMMPLSTTTMALPVTSKPIESTVENLAWQAWIELPPEEKQQVKSRKVTPKSIFTLPLRVECPEGHKQVDTKCIPLVIGSNAVLIDLNALGLVVGNTPSDELYDYDDIGEDEEEKFANPRPLFGSDMQMGDVEKSMEGLTVELRPPSKDEPLKFNIFESKFNILHEEPLEDYSALSNEGASGGGEKEGKNVTASDVTEQQQQQQQTLNATDAAKILSDLASESSNISENNFALAKPLEKISSADAKEISSTSSTALVDDKDEDFKIDAISLPVGGLDTQNQPQKLAIFQKDTDGMQLVTTIMDAETATTTTGDEKPQENDIQTLLQTESFLPLQQQTNVNATAATILQSQEQVQANNSSSIAGVLTTISLPTNEQMENTPEVLNLNIEEEMTTLPSAMEPEPPQKSKQEFTRSVTINPLMAEEGIANDDDNDRVNESTTLETEMIDEPNAETTTPIQLDETTVIETFSSLSSTPATLQQQQPQEQQYDLQDLLMQQEQALKDFEELQRMRSKGQTDPHAVLKKSKVEPVEVLATTTTANSLPTTDPVEAAVETVTPLLTFDNENDSDSNSNDRFYYQHFAKQDIKEAQQPSQTVPTTTATATSVTTKLSEIEAMPLTTSEIDRSEELRLINELVKGITSMPTTTGTTTTTTTTTTAKPKTTLKIKIPTSLSSATQSESSSLASKTLPNSQQIWSKIMPLLTSTTTTTTTTTTTPKSTKTVSISEKSSIDSSTEYTENISNDIQATSTKATSSESGLLLSSSSTRSNRNSKITRIHTADVIASETTTEPHSSSESFTATNSGSSTETATLNNAYEPYWWLPVAWRFDKPNDSVSSERPNEQLEEEQDQTQEVISEEPSLLLRFWSTYHASKSS